ncbi:MAG: cell division topological specificity factor MinE [Lachnospiraceae bacterium]|nr:cell division topological specificity factor MinE [Lachnospiraceae bacterium]
MKTGSKRTLLTSGEIAKARARLAVSADRVERDPATIDQLRGELTDVLAKYFPVDDDNMEIRLSFLYIKRGMSDVKTIQVK